MSVTIRRFGTTVEATNVRDPRIVGFAASLPNGTCVWQPASQLPLFDQLASGVPIPMSDGQRDFVRSMGIDLSDVTDSVREAAAWEQIKVGTTRDLVNVSVSQIEPHYSAKGVTITTGFRPVSSY